ncbi:hypothetical protein B586_17255 [Mycobacterium haemophilum DSM 44634]|nr:hypothetical protein B586_17255 [Mycobacterium haemophilum DSM 44634]
MVAWAGLGVVTGNSDGVRAELVFLPGRCRDLMLSDGATSVVIVVTTTSLRLELTWQPAVLLQPGEHNSYLRWAEWGSDCIRRSDTMYELEFQLPIN